MWCFRGETGEEEGEGGVQYADAGKRSAEKEERKGGGGGGGMVGLLREMFLAGRQQCGPGRAWGGRGAPSKVPLSFSRVTLAPGLNPGRQGAQRKLRRERWR